MTRRLLLPLAILTALLVTTPPSPAPASAASACPEVSGVLVIGDSLTVNATNFLEARKPNWRIDALWGRGVTRLPVQLDLWLGSHRHPPRILIVALGTNEQAGWSKMDYRLALRKVPARTRVVFVNTWRPLATSTGQVYSRWMREIADARPNTTLANWRLAAIRDPSLVSADGVHQSRVGARAWARLVIDAAEKVSREGARYDRRHGCR